jgi:hypothetical protein
MKPKNSRMLHRILFASVWILLILMIPIVDAGNLSNGTDTREYEIPDSTVSDRVTPSVLHTSGEEIISTTMFFRQKSISPAVQRKISSNLLYLIDADISESGPGREVVQNQMVTEGKLMTRLSAASPGTQDMSVPADTETTGSFVLVYIDLVPEAPTSAVDSYVSSVTERSEQDHSVVAWVDANAIDTLASLDAVSNVRTAEPSVTKESPVYHDTKFINKRAGLPPATVDEAKESVRAFENVPSRALEQGETITNSRGDIYSLVSDDARYYVNAKTGEVEMASYSYYANFPVQKQPEIQKSISAGDSMEKYPLNVNSAFPIAQDFARNMYDNYDNRTLVLTQSRIIDHGDAGKTGLFIWNEKVNEIVTPNGVVVSVNAYNGKILSYIGIDQPHETDVIPSVSKEDAIGKAVSRFSPISVTDTSARLAILPVDKKSQKLVWITNINGEPEDNIHRGGSAMIDAHSGEVLEVDPYA